MKLNSSMQTPKRKQNAPARAMLLLPLLVVFLILSGAPQTLAEKLEVPKDYSTIQAAVDAAQPGDEIEVEEGVYAERVVIDKDMITLKGKED